MFSSIKNGSVFGDAISIPANTVDLKVCIRLIITGFEQLITNLEGEPDAISFAFPGPADYEQGIIGDLPNLPAFKGGIPLGPIIQEHFDIPVFINNDGNLFVLGESKSGFLPYVNQLLKESGSSKQFNNLIGVTLGTGFGVGISLNGTLLAGDNGVGGEGWLLRNKHYTYSNVEETLSVRSIKRMYAEQISIDPSNSPEPNQIFDIAVGKAEGVREAAVETYLRYGEVLGDAIAHILALVDGLVVIGGGISGAYPIFSKSMMDELNGNFTLLNGKKLPRLIHKLYNLENDFSRKSFLSQRSKPISIPGTKRALEYFEEKSTAIGLSRLGASEAISVGAYYYVLDKMG